MRPRLLWLHHAILLPQRNGMQQLTRNSQLPTDHFRLATVLRRGTVRRFAKLDDMQTVFAADGLACENRFRVFINHRLVNVDRLVDVKFFLTRKSVKFKTQSDRLVGVTGQLEQRPVTAQGGIGTVNFKAKSGQRPA